MYSFFRFNMRQHVKTHRWLKEVTWSYLMTLPMDLRAELIEAREKEKVKTTDTNKIVPDLVDDLPEGEAQSRMNHALRWVVLKCHRSRWG
jgi:hypothetical protein